MAVHHRHYQSYSSSSNLLFVDHGYKVGSQIRFSVSSSFGMTEINGLVGNVVAVDTVTGTTNTFTVDIDSTNFTTFAFPTSAVANQGVQFPQAILCKLTPEG